MTCTQLEFTAQRTGQTQNERLRDYLVMRPGRWLAMPELVEATGSYVVHSRVADLRKAGMNIEHRNEFAQTEGGRVCKSSYRYVPL